MNPQFVKCNHCGYYFITRAIQLKCPECHSDVKMTTRDQMEANMRKERYFRRELALFKGTDFLSVYRNKCFKCKQVFFTENENQKSCLPCRHK